MRRLDELAAFQVGSLKPLRKVSVHDPIEHDINAGEVGNRFKDARAFEQSKNAGKVDLQSGRKSVVDIEWNAPLVSFLHQGGVAELSPL